MTAQQDSRGVGCIFWMVIAIIVVGPLGTCALVGFINLRHDSSKAIVATPVSAPEAAQAPVDPRVKQDAARICAAYRALAKTLSDDAFNDGAVIWKKLGLTKPPDDPWGRPYEWQGWNRSVRSQGPDRTRGTGDDMTVRCEG